MLRSYAPIVLYFAARIWEYLDMDNGAAARETRERDDEIQGRKHSRGAVL